MSAIYRHISLMQDNARPHRCHMVDDILKVKIYLNHIYSMTAILWEEKLHFTTPPTHPGTIQFPKTALQNEWNELLYEPINYLISIKVRYQNCTTVSRDHNTYWPTNNQCFIFSVPMGVTRYYDCVLQLGNSFLSCIILCYA